MENNNDFGFGFNDVRFSDRTLIIELLPDQVSNAVENNEYSSSTDAIQTKIIHISTLILAGKSSFFYKLFSNGMAESSQLCILQLQESEEAAFMDLLKFMYSNSLSSTTLSALRNVLMAAEKYGVASCMKYCIQSLQKLPMTCESAMLYLDLPSTILMDDTTRPLIDAAKKCLDDRFLDIRKFEKEMLNLPLARIEAILSRDDLQVSSEDEIYDFVMKWAQRNYTEPSKRREMLNMRLLRLIRFRFLSRSKLEKVVFDAISLETPNCELPPMKEQERAYKLRPVKVIRFNFPRHEECVVYVDLKREECTNLLPNETINSQAFDLGGNVFTLMGGHHTKKPSFALCLCKVGKESVGVEFKFEARKKSRGEFVLMYSGYSSFAETILAGTANPFNMSWNKFVAEDNPYFIDGVLHIRAEIKTRKM